MAYLKLIDTVIIIELNTNIITLINITISL